ncbi:MAG: hypothetical protein JWP67_168 [Mucilaginibacter sp.]|nr:hypothetical protein [Mucilaginibacter sp.]
MDPINENDCCMLVKQYIKFGLPAYYICIPSVYLTSNLEAIVLDAVVN